MIFGIGKFEIVITAILFGIIMLIVHCNIEKDCTMAVEEYVGIGVGVQLEETADIYHALDAIHTQSLEKFGEKAQETMFLVECMDTFNASFDTDGM